MKLPIYIVDSVGAGVSGLTLSGAEVKVSIDGAAFATAGGTVTAVGSGAYYYETTAADLLGETLVLRVEDSGGSRPFVYELRVPIAYDFPAGTATARRYLPIFLIDTSNAPVTGAAPAGAQIQMSVDGAAWANTDAARFHEIGLGEYYYDPTDAQVAARGLLMLKVNGVAVTYIYAALVGPSPLAISNLTPNTDDAGEPGAFSYQFGIARLTPIEFDLAGITAGMGITITVHFQDRNEPYTALDHEGVWRWPFDVEPDNSIGDLDTEPAHVTLLPRGGWPATGIEISVAECSQAVNP